MRNSTNTFLDQILICPYTVNMNKMKSLRVIFCFIVGVCFMGICSCESSKTTLTYIGHASVKIVAKDGSVLYIDPNYSDGDYSMPADFIIVTHQHEDHKPCRKVKLKDDGQQFDNRDFLHDGIYETMNLGPFTVEAVPAGNKNHDIRYCVGYIVTVDGVKIYHAGDTSMIDQMADLKPRKLDYAMYPIDGMYNMDAVEATKVAEVVGARFSIPIHENDQGNSKKSDNFTPNGRLILEYGQTITVSPR